MLFSATKVLKRFIVHIRGTFLFGQNLQYIGHSKITHIINIIKKTIKLQAIKTSLRIKCVTETHQW